MSVRILPADPDDRALQGLLADYARFLTATIPDEGPDPIPLPLTDAQDYRPPRGATSLATTHGRPLGCIFLRSLSPGLGEVKRLYVTPEARGLGIARRLLQAIEVQALALGMTRLNLDTSEILKDAVALYRSAGWTETAPYSPYPATLWFTKALQP